MNSAVKTLVVLSVTALTLSACGGGKATSTTTVQTATVGEQLASLEDAYAQGLLSEEEYDQQREKILDGE